MSHQTYKITKERPDFTAIVLDPGWVKTGEQFAYEEIASPQFSVHPELGGEGAQLEPEFSASHIIKLVNSLKNEDSGKFFAYTGKTIPW